MFGEYRKHNTIMQKRIVHILTIFAMLIVSIDAHAQSKLDRGVGSSHVSTSLNSIDRGSDRYNLSFINSSSQLTRSIKNSSLWSSSMQSGISSKESNKLYKNWGKLITKRASSIKLGHDIVSFSRDSRSINEDIDREIESRDRVSSKIRGGSTYNRLSFAQLYDNRANEDNYAQLSYNHKTSGYITVESEKSDFIASILLINKSFNYKSGKSNAPKSVNRQTLIAQFNKKHNSVTIDGLGQVQTDNINKLDMATFKYSLSAGVDINREWKSYIGTDMQSKTESYDINSGRFDGLMNSYNICNNSEIFDLYGGIKYSSGKHDINLEAHYITSSLMGSGNYNHNSKMGQKAAMNVNYGFTFRRALSFSAGYSHLFDSDSLSTSKDSGESTSNNWGWVTITFRPSY